ncbi:hypothetical protein KIN20_017046 [Parelaphostrongylus tenuis]|uniref:Uncharacterized protein n=1 Tax=Parelaphostrongylus tenuis TaxID=148309 RepID=A0AAD5N2M3_PARTN|nr:hypothetical protein KIN20_017046 [Parelaphostrongylus tenuis]
MVNSCIIVGRTVTGICPKMANPAGRGMPYQDVATAIDGEHLTLSGTLTVGTAFLFVQLHFKKKNSMQTTNIVMANWSRSMWQNVVDRALRMLRSGPFGSHLYTVTVTVS